MTFFFAPTSKIMSNNGCGQLGAIQTRGTCWFYSILNGFILSEAGQKILYIKLKEFYEKLKPDEKAYFDDQFNAPCPIKANLTKTNAIYFWKFVDQYLCFMSGPRVASLKAGRSASILGGMSLKGTAAREAAGGSGGFPQAEIANILDHVGFSGDYYMLYKSESIKFHGGRKPTFVVVRQSKKYENEYMYSIPEELLQDPAYELMSASLVIGNTSSNIRSIHRWHAISGYVCNGKGYIYDSNQRKVFPCKWWDLLEFKKVVNKKIADHYSHFRGGKINVHTYAFAIFARKDAIKGAAPACLMKYTTKTPNIALSNNFFTDPLSGAVINNPNRFTFLKPAQRAALKRKWARTEHRPAPFLTQSTINSIINSAESRSLAIQMRNNLRISGYKISDANSKYFNNKLEVKFRKYTFTEAKAHLNKFKTKTDRKREYSRVWKGIPLAQRKVLMHYRNKGEWLANNSFENKGKRKVPSPSPSPKAKTPSPSPRTQRATQLRKVFTNYWSGLSSNNRQTIRNYIASYKSPVPIKKETPSPKKSTLNNAKRNVNALKTAKARKEYKRTRAANMNTSNWTELGRYIARKNLEAQQARAAKKSVAK